MYVYIDASNYNLIFSPFQKYTRSMGCFFYMFWHPCLVELTDGAFGTVDEYVGMHPKPFVTCTDRGSLPQRTLHGDILLGCSKSLTM